MSWSVLLEVLLALAIMLGILGIAVVVLNVAAGANFGHIP